MNREKFYKAIKSVSEDLCSLSKFEFEKELESHKDGDIAQFLLETGALEVGKIEAESFDYFSAPYAEESELNVPSFEEYNVIDDISKFLKTNMLPVNVVQTFGLGNTIIPCHNVATLMGAWSNQPTSFSIQLPTQLSFFGQKLAGYEIFKDKSYDIVGKITVGSTLSANKEFSGDELEYQLAA